MKNKIDMSVYDKIVIYTDDEKFSKTTIFVDDGELAIDTELEAELRRM